MQYQRLVLSVPPGLSVDERLAFQPTSQREMQSRKCSNERRRNAIATNLSSDAITTGRKLHIYLGHIFELQDRNYVNTQFIIIHVPP